MQLQQLILLSISLIDIARTSRDGEVERIEKTERIPGVGHVPLMVDDPSSSSNIDNNAVLTGITGTPTVVEYRFGAVYNDTNIDDNTITAASSQLHFNGSLMIAMIMIILRHLFAS